MSTRTTLLENDYASLWYYPDTGIIHHQLHQPVPDEIFRTVLMTGLNLMQEHGANKWLSDDRKNSILSAEVSAWSQNIWLPLAIKAGWKHWALLPTSNARGRKNAERLMKYVTETYGIKLEIFADPEDAQLWLAQQ